jgi:hypothetical protein
MKRRDASNKLAQLKMSQQAAAQRKLRERRQQARVMADAHLEVMQKAADKLSRETKLTEEVCAKDNGRQERHVQQLAAAEAKAKLQARKRGNTINIDGNDEVSYGARATSGAGWARADNMLSSGLNSFSAGGTAASKRSRSSAAEEKLELAVFEWSELVAGRQVAVSVPAAIRSQASP